MITKEKLKKYANLLMFDMEDSEYEVLLKEFVNLENEMEKISKFDKINEVEPMHFPFPIEELIMNEDETGDFLTNEESLSNVKEEEHGEVKLPKVVGSNDN